MKAILKKNDDTKQRPPTNSRRRALTAVLALAAVTFSCAYAIVGIVRVRSAMNRLLVSDKNAQEIIQRLDSEKKVPFEDDDANELVVPAVLSEQEGKLDER